MVARLMLGSGGETRATAVARPVVRRLLAVAGIAAVAAAVACASVASASRKPRPQTFRLVPEGPSQVVYDYNVQRCDDRDFPDLPVRAFRASDGSVVLYYGSSNGARAFVGPDLDHLEH